MVNITTIPVSTATTQELLLEFNESMCRPYFTNNTSLPTANVVLSQGTNITLNGNIVVPVVATITVAVPKKCGCVTSRVFTETFNIPFNPNTTNVVTLAKGTSDVVSATNVRCNKAYGVKILTTLTADIA